MTWTTNLHSPDTHQFKDYFIAVVSYLLDTILTLRVRRGSNNFFKFGDCFIFMNLIFWISKCNVYYFVINASMQGSQKNLSFSINDTRLRCKLDREIAIIKFKKNFTLPEIQIASSFNIFRNQDTFLCHRQILSWIKTSVGVKTNF